MIIKEMKATPLDYATLDWGAVEGLKHQLGRLPTNEDNLEKILKEFLNNTKLLAKLLLMFGEDSGIMYIGAKQFLNKIVEEKI